MAKNPAYPMYAQDFDMDTASWSVTAIGVYVRLMNYSWINGPLPDDTEALARIARMDHGNFRKVWCPLVQSKWMKTEHGLVNSRMEIEREKRAKFIEHQRSKGKKSGEVRGNRGSTVVEPEHEPEGNLSFSSSLGSNEPSLLIPPNGGIVPETSGDVPTSDDHPKQNGHCPHREIITLYHEILPSLNPVKEWTEDRQKMLRSRWREKAERQSLGWWRYYFGYVGESDFLMGRAGDFMADLEWLIRPKNFVKVIEGRYHSRNGSNPLVSKSTQGILGWAARERARMAAKEDGQNDA